MCWAGRSCAACRCCSLLARLSRPSCCPVSFSAGAVCAGNLMPLFGLPRRGCRGVPQSRRLCFRPARRLLLLCLDCAAARRLCAGLPAGAPAFCGFVPGLRAASAFAPGLRAVRFVCAAFPSCFFAFSCLTSSSQISFHLSLRPRRASTFFRKESRQRFAKGLRPFEPHSCALRSIFSSSSLLAGLTALRAANRRLTGETLEKAKEQSSAFSSVSVRRRTPAPFRRSPPFFSLLAGLTALRAANRRLAWETPEMPRSKAPAFRAFLCVGVRLAPRFTYLWKFGAGFCPAGFLPDAGNRSQAFSLSGKTEAVRGRALEKNRVRARLGESINTVRDLPAAGALLAGLTALRAANRRLAWETPEMPRSKAQLFGRFCAWGNGWPHVLRIHESLARAFARRIFSLSQGTGARLFPCPGKQKPCAGTHLKKTACVRDAGKKKTRCATCPAQPRGRARCGGEKDRANRFAGSRRATGCIAGDEPAGADSPAPGRRVRVLLAAGAQER